MQPLRPGDPIDVVAPSSAFDRERFERGIRALRDMQLVPRYTDEIFARTGHLAGSDERRKADRRDDPGIERPDAHALRRRHHRPES